MKLSFSDVRLVGGGIGNPGKKNLLTATFQADFGPLLAESLGCKDDCFVDGTASLRPFSFHGLRVELSDADLDFQLPGDKKMHRFRASLGDLEVMQKKRDLATINFKVSFEGEENKIRAFTMLFMAEEGPTTFARVVVNGAQKELFKNDEPAEPGAA